MTVLVRCKIYPGQFSDEYAISGEQVGGERFSLFAPEKYVKCEEAATREKAVDGWLKASLFEQLDDCAVIMLPRESLECGSFVTLGIDQIRKPADQLEKSL